MSATMIWLSVFGPQSWYVQWREDKGKLLNGILSTCLQTVIKMSLTIAQGTMSNKRTAVMWSLQNTEFTTGWRLEEGLSQRKLSFMMTVCYMS